MKRLLVIVSLVIVVLAGTAFAQSRSLGSDRFTDVPSGHWADAAIGWAVDEGITLGVSDTEFGLGQTLTREQMIVFLCRALKPDLCAPAKSSPTTTTTLASSTPNSFGNWLYGETNSGFSFSIRAEGIDTRGNPLGTTGLLGLLCFDDEIILSMSVFNSSTDSLMPVVPSSGDEVIIGFTLDGGEAYAQLWEVYGGAAIVRPDLLQSWLSNLHNHSRTILAVRAVEGFSEISFYHFDLTGAAGAIAYTQNNC